MSDNKSELGIIRMLKSRLLAVIKEREALAIRLEEKENEITIIRNMLRAGRESVPIELDTK